MKPLVDKLELTLDCQLPGQTAIERLVAADVDISVTKLKKAMQYGALWLTRGKQTRRVRKHKLLLEAGDRLHFYYDEAVLFAPPMAAQLVADKRAYSIWNKPCGMFSQGTKWGDHTAICRWVELNAFSDRQAFLVHRLDRATKGLIVVAHRKKVASQLCRLFENREVEKHYRAQVEGEFPASVFQIDSDIEEKRALTRIIDYRFDKKTNRSWLRLKLETGRKHQIRKHLASVGFPIIGDRLYGAKADSGNAELSDLQLESCLIGFRCPLTGQDLCFEI